jgi:hypothetical protein
MSKTELRVETIQSLLYQLGLTQTVAGDGVVVVRVEEGREWVKIGLVIPKRPEPVRFMERRSK